MMKTHPSNEKTEQERSTMLITSAGGRVGLLVDMMDIEVSADGYVDA